MVKGRSSSLISLAGNALGNSEVPSATPFLGFRHAGAVQALALMAMDEAADACDLTTSGPHQFPMVLALCPPRRRLPGLA